MRLASIVVTHALVALAALAASASASAEEQPLWNGKDLTGWKQVGPGQFVVENGVLKTTGGMGLLYWTGGKVGDSVIRVVYKNEKKNSNAGVFIRIPEAPTEPWMPVNKGYEVQIDDAQDDYHVTGVLYSLTKAKAHPGKPGEWNTLEITLDGPRTRVTVNGELVTDYTEGEAVPEKKEDFEPDRGPRPNAGYFGLQNHNDKDVVYFKEVTVRPLAKK
jgi:3-keto-disaccharide hydrolase